MNAVLYILKTGIPWRQLPEEYGYWKNVHKRLSRWCKSGVFNNILSVLAQESDKKAKMLLLDSSVVRAHQHAAGAESPVGDEALGRSRGGFSTKIHASVDENGCPHKVFLSGGQVHDSQYASNLLEDSTASYVLADKAYASDKIVQQIKNMGSTAVIPPHQSSKTARPYDRGLYKRRNVIERFFNRMKQYRGVSTRYSKRAANFLGCVQLVSIMITLAI